MASWPGPQRTQQLVHYNHARPAQYTIRGCHMHALMLPVLMQYCPEHSAATAALHADHIM